MNKKEKKKKNKEIVWFLLWRNDLVVTYQDLKYSGLT